MFVDWSVHPGRLTWNIIIEVEKIIFQMGYLNVPAVNLPGCSPCKWFFFGEAIRQGGFVGTTLMPFNPVR